MAANRTIEEQQYVVTVARDRATGVITYEAWDDKDGALHREGGPALVRRDFNTGVVTQELWRKHGRSHREDGPALIERDPVTQIVTHEKWAREGKVCRSEGPSEIYRNASTGKVTFTRWDGVEGGASRRIRDEWHRLQRSGNVTVTSDAPETIMPEPG